MTIFGVKTKKEESIINYLITIDDNLKGDNLLYNPFNGKIKAIEKDDYMLFVFNIRPIYADFSYFGYIIILASYIFYFNYLIIIPGLMICASHFFWTRYFYYAILKYSFHKKSLGKIVLISDRELLEELTK